MTQFCVKGATGSSQAVQWLEQACPGGISKSRLDFHMKIVGKNFRTYQDTDRVNKTWVWDNNGVYDLKSRHSGLDVKFSIPIWTTQMLIKSRLSINPYLLFNKPEHIPAHWTRSKADVHPDLIFTGLNEKIGTQGIPQDDGIPAHSEFINWIASQNLQLVIKERLPYRVLDLKDKKSAIELKDIIKHLEKFQL